jgi:hypothetical protein
MKTPSGSSWFVAVGASAVVFIGAFAHFDPVAPPTPPLVVAAKPIADEKVAPEPVVEPPMPDDSSSSMAEVIRLAESHVAPDVMLAFIQNSRQTYAPTADEILYLSRLGVPQNIISALFPAQPEQTNAMAVATPARVPDEEPPQEAVSNMFTEALAPYGNWVQVPNYGAAWQPAVEVANPDWKPYVDDGQWINSDSGWYWQSDYAWGWAPFHYGGWVNAAAPLGWVWVPGRTWGPAWVSWRMTPSYIGWAALPPGVSLNVLSQLTFSGHPISPDFDFGVVPSSYVFVRASRFLSTNLQNRVTPAERTANLVAESTVINNYKVMNNRVINGGVSRAVVTAAAKRPVPEVVLQPISSAPDPVQSSAALLASAHVDDAAWPSMQLPPLHYGAPPAGFVKHDSARGYGAGTYDRPATRDSGPPPPPQFHPTAESRSAPAAPVREAAAAAASSSSAAKSTK